MQESGRKLASKVSSRVEDLLGIVYPIIQAPFGGFASQRLTATVSNLGGLGSLGVVSLNESAIRDAVVEMLRLTNKPFAVNLWVSTSDPQWAFINHDTAAKKMAELAQYYAELGVEAPPVPQVVPQELRGTVLCSHQRWSSRAQLRLRNTAFRNRSRVSPEISSHHSHGDDTRRSHRTRKGRHRSDCGLRFRRRRPPRILPSLTCAIAHGEFFVDPSGGGCSTNSYCGGRRNRGWAWP